MCRNVIGSLFLSLIVALVGFSAPAIMESAATTLPEPPPSPPKADTGESLWKEKIAGLNDLAAMLKATKETVKDKKTAAEAAGRITTQIDKVNDIRKRFTALKITDKEKKDLKTKYLSETGDAMLALGNAAGAVVEAVKKVPNDAIPLLTALKSLNELMDAVAKE